MSRALKERAPSIGYPFPATIIGLVWVGYDEPDELFIKFKEINKEIIFPPSMGGKIYSNDQRYSNCNWGMLANCRGISLIKYHKSYLYGSEERILTLWYDYLKELSEIEDPIVRYFSHIARAECMSYDREVDRPDLVKEQFQKASDVMINEILTSDSLLRHSTMQILSYRFKRTMKFAFGYDYDTLKEIHKSIYEALIEKNNAIALSCWEPGRETIPIDRSVLDPASAKRYYELLDEATLILQNSSGDERLLKGALAGIKDCQLEIRLLYPQLDIKRKPSGFAINMLLKKTDWPGAFPGGFSTMQISLKNGCLYTVNISDNSLLMFSIIDIAHKKINALYQTNLTAHPRYLTGLVVGDSNSFASITYKGLIVLPGALSRGKEILSTVKILTQKDGLPSVNITGIAENNQQLWVAYGEYNEESGLGLYNPGSGSWETFICSTIKGDSPLNSGQSYGSALNQLIPVPPDKLYFLIGRTMNSNMRKWMGLWKMYIDTRELVYIGYCGLSEAYGGHLENNGEEIWCKGTSTLIKFIPESEDAVYVFGQFWNPDIREEKYLRPSERGNRFTWLNCRNDLFVSETSLNKIPFGPFDMGALDLTTSAIHGDELWALLGKSQIIILQQGKSYEQAEIIDNDILGGEPVCRFVSTPYGLIVIGNGTVGLIETGNNHK
jgi:hypothetical protein